MERLFGPNSGTQTPTTTSTSKKSTSTTGLFNSPVAKQIAREVDQNVDVRPKRSNTISSSDDLESNKYSVEPLAKDDIDTSLGALKSEVMRSNVVVESKKKVNNFSKFSASAIDSLLGAPEKIDIPERYIPDAVS